MKTIRQECNDVFPYVNTLESDYGKVRICYQFAVTLLLLVCTDPIIYTSEHIYRPFGTEKDVERVFADILSGRSRTVPRHVLASTGSLPASFPTKFGTEACIF
jgi:hypothetical protein